MDKILSYFRNVLFQLGLSLVLNIITWLIVLFKIKPNSELLPLRYNIFYGADLIGKGYYILLIPLIGLAVLIINYYLYRYSVKREEFAAKILVAIALVTQIIILVAILFLKSIIVI